MRKKATTSILPYLREKEKQVKRAVEAVAPADKPKSLVKSPKPEARAGELSEYDKARLSILRGEE